MDAESASDFTDRGSFFQQPSGELQLLITHLFGRPKRTPRF